MAAMHSKSGCLAALLPVLMWCTTVSGRLLAAENTSALNAQVKAEQSSHVPFNFTSCYVLPGFSPTGSEWGTAIGTSIGALMLVFLWAIRCCLKHASSDLDQLSDVDRPNSPLLTPRTPQSPRSEGRRSWCHPPPTATYTPPPVKLLNVPHHVLSYDAASTSASVLLFTKEQLSSARDTLCAAADRFITSSVQAGATGSVRSWLLKGLPPGEDVTSSSDVHPAAPDDPNISTSDSDCRKQLEVLWARHQLWRWLQDNMWGGLDNPLVARGKGQGSLRRSADEGVTKTQAARELLSAIKKNPAHKAFRTAVTVFSQQLMTEMSASETQPAGSVSAAIAAAVNGVVEMALLFQLQMLGTSAGMQTYVPGDSSAETEAPDGAVVVEGDAPQESDTIGLICVKPGLLELRSLGGSPQTVVVLQAQAVYCTY